MKKERKWKMPKHGHFTHYCCHCKHWQFVNDVGCAHLGICYAVKDERTIQDAYDPPCGLWEGRHNAKLS